MTICIHSLWRSCSTYFALKFRKPELNTYWYYEPYNEIISRLTNDIAVGFNCDSWESRHPNMDQGYYFEYLPLIQSSGVGVRLYKECFAYDRYFPHNVLGIDEKKYLNSLIDYAKKQNKIPVLAFCRSLGRVGHLRYIPQSTHITQYRNPHQTLKSFEDAKFMHLIDLCINNTSPKSLSAQLGLNVPQSVQYALNVSNNDINIFHSICDKSVLSSLFFEFYVVANFAAFFFSDIIFNVNSISSDERCRTKLSEDILQAANFDVLFDDIDVRDEMCSTIYDPQMFENAVDKYIGNTKKIETFKRLAEEICGVPSVKSCMDIESIRDEMLSKYASSDEVCLRKALSASSCALSECGLGLTRQREEIVYYENLQKSKDSDILKIKDSLNQEISSLRSNIEGLLQKNADLEKEKNEELAKIKDALTGKYLESLDKCTQLEKMFEAELADKQLTLERCEISLKAVKSENEIKLNNTTAEMNFLHNNMSVQLAQVKNKLAYVESLVNPLKERVSALEASLSWKITAPMRYVVRCPLACVRLLKRKYTLLRYRSVLGESASFDPVYYMQNNPDVMLSGQDALTHFMLDGWKEGRNPSANFDISWYLLIYCDVRKSQINPLLHYVLYGRSEGRSAKRYTAVSQPESIYENSKISLSVAKRILVVDTVIPRPDVHAGELATFGILKTLCSVEFDVVYLPLNMEPNPPYEVPLAQMGVQSITRETSYCTPQQYVEAQGHTFDVFYIMRVESAEALLSIIRERAPHARVIYHSADLYFLREGRQAAIEKNPMLEEQSNLSRERELRMMRESDLAVVVSPVERQILLEYLAPEKVTLFPVLYAPVSQNPAGYNERKDIFFIGGFNHTPNVDAVLWFVQDVWPLIYAQLPTVTFHIVGAQMPDSIKILGKERGVNIVGYVPDLQPLLETMRVGVAPLRYGAGIKGKVAVTMGAGIPCVCTSVASEGMWLTHGDDTLIADDALSFAQAVISLYPNRSTWESMSNRARKHVDAYFGEVANSRSLLRVLRDAHCLPLDVYVAYCKSLQSRPLPVISPGITPEVSIIIPVYNQWDLTRDCINSVLEDILAPDSPSVEIILADDGSSDETINAVKHFPGLRVIKTEYNCGFLRNVNNATKYARGNYFVLLNNDTITLPGWLFNLYSAIKTNINVGAVGSKILNNDGSVQEAGSGVLSTGQGWNLNVGLSQYDKLVCQDYPVHYVSGCSLMFSAAMWNHIQGFDETYENAYYEDVDLCTNIRSQGLQLLYISNSEIIHYNHATYENRDYAENHLHVVNRDKFKRKWDNFLASHPHPSCGDHFVIEHALIAHARKSAKNIC